jgi:hypothetical protein
MPQAVRNLSEQVMTGQAKSDIKVKSGELSISHKNDMKFDISMKAVRIYYGYRAVYRLFYHIEEDKQKEILSRPTPSSFLERNAM